MEYSKQVDNTAKTVHSIYDINGEHVVVDKPPIPELKHLPPIVFRLNYDEAGGTFSFSNETSSFNVPETIFGKKYRTYSKLIWTQYRKQKLPLGVLLSGDKGSGKSLLAELLGNMMITARRPVVIISQKVPIAVIMKVLKITGPCMLMFDEISKYYDREEQDRLLPLFSNSTIEEVMFVICDNEVHSLSKYIQDRPGRFLYHIKFNGIDKDTCDEICSKYKLLPQIIEHIHAYIVENRISMDVMRVLADKASECKTYDDYLVVFEVLNIPKPTFKELNVTITFPGGLDPEEQAKIKAGIICTKIDPTTVVVKHGDEKVEVRADSRYDSKANLGRLLVSVETKATSAIQPPPGSDIPAVFVEETGGDGKRVSRW